VENTQAARLLLKVAPVRIGLGNVAAEDKLLTGFADNQRRCVAKGLVPGEAPAEETRIAKGLARMKPIVSA
jgi:hypothetical protein